MWVCALVAKRVFSAGLAAVGIMKNAPPIAQAVREASRTSPFTVIAFPGCTVKRSYHDIFVLQIS